jgi:non-homologous end joining protein Ku
MAPRAYWKGTLKLSLVTCRVALYPGRRASQSVIAREAKQSISRHDG